MAPSSSAPLTGTPRRSKASRTSPVGGPLQCSVSTLRQCSRSASRIAFTYASRAGHFRSANWVTRWSYEAAHFPSAPVSQSDQCTRVPPRSKITARGAAIRSKLYETTVRSRSAHPETYGPLVAFLALRARAVLCPALPEADARAPAEQGVPRLRAASQDAPDHDDSSPGDDELPRVPSGSLHRHRGLRAGPPRGPPHTRGHAHRLSHPLAGRPRPCCGTDRVRIEASQGKSHRFCAPLRNVRWCPPRDLRRRARHGPERRARSGGSAARERPVGVPGRLDRSRARAAESESRRPDPHPRG